MRILLDGGGDYGLFVKLKVFFFESAATQVVFFAVQVITERKVGKLGGI